MRKKLCCILNMAPLYRKAIYNEISKTFDTKWFVGSGIDSIKEIPAENFRYYKNLERKRIKGPVYWQKGAVRAFLNEDEADFLITGELFCLSTWVILAINSLRRKNVYLWSHGWYGKESRLKNWLKRLYFGMSNGVFLYGEYAKKVAVASGMSADKLHVIHNSLDYDRQLKIRIGLERTDLYQSHFHNDLPTLIFIGRLTEVKKLDMLIRAASILKSKGKAVNVVLVGDGPEKPRCIELADSLGVNIWMYGESYDERVNAELIYNSDLCVSPGNVGLTAIHSQMFGTPVITHNNFQKQMPEFESVKRGFTGDFFEEGSDESLADCIGSWLENKAGCRDEVRHDCFRVIDAEWSVPFQIKVLDSVIK